MKSCSGGQDQWPRCHTRERENEDIKHFLRRMEYVDEEVARRLNAEHEQRQRRLPTVEAVFEPGDRVWVRRPEHTADKFGSKWIGVGVVQEREGARSYRVRVEPHRVITVPLKDMKRVEEDEYGPVQMNMFYHKRTEKSKSDRSVHPRALRKISGHRCVAGRLELKVQWEGDFGELESSWEGAGEVFAEERELCISYAKQKGIEGELLETLSARGGRDE